MSIKKTLTFYRKCAAPFSSSFREMEEGFIWIIIKIMLNEEKPEYSVKMRLKKYERIEEYYKKT